MGKHWRTQEQARGLPPEPEDRLCTLLLCPAPLLWVTPASWFKFSLNRCVPKMCPVLEVWEKISAPKGHFLLKRLSVNKKPKALDLYLLVFMRFFIRMATSKDCTTEREKEGEKGGREGIPLSRAGYVPKRGTVSHPPGQTCTQDEVFGSLTLCNARLCIQMVLRTGAFMNWS